MSSSDAPADAVAVLRIVPGQLWRWALEPNDGFWLWQRVTEAGRGGFDASTEVVYQGDLFMVMVVDDPGPYELPNLPGYDAMGVPLPVVVHRWHVVLLRDTLYWFRHDYFLTSELVRDVA